MVSLVYQLRASACMLHSFHFFAYIGIMEVFALKFPESMRLSDDEFYTFFQENCELRLEKTQHGDIIIMPPTGGVTGSINANITTELKLWNRSAQLGKAFDSSTGFILPNGAARSPDASWIAKSRWDALSPEKQQKFPPLCPDFVVELMSGSNGLKAAQEKMHEWMENGCRLAWLFYPTQEKAFIYREGQAWQEISGYDQSLTGEEVLPGFTFDLQWLTDR